MANDRTGWRTGLRGWRRGRRWQEAHRLALPARLHRFPLRRAFALDPLPGEERPQTTQIPQITLAVSLRDLWLRAAERR
jgi:hypothetical protein